LLSPIGFAYAPQVLNFLTLVSLLGQPIGQVLAVWSLLAVIVAVHEFWASSTKLGGVALFSRLASDSGNNTSN